MDFSEAAKVVMERISRMEPEPIAKKIMGYIYFQGFPDQEMIRLALGPDSVIHSLIHQAKNARLFASSPHASPPISPPINPSPLSDRFQSTPFSPSFRYWDPQIASDQSLMHNQPFKMVPEYTCLEDPFSEAVRSGPSTFSPNRYTSDNLSIRGARNAPSPMEHSVKMCHYFIKGFCKHGSNCRYLHGESSSASNPLIFGPNNSYEVGGDDQVFPPGSLDKLELEIAELLKSQKGLPVSIASLPTLYYAKYGKTIQAEGYLTESQRHGKAGYSLTKLLARLKNSIRLIDRPHGQHDVILAEEASKYVDIRGERNDPGPIVSGSRQIFLTFPAESAFNEEDVSNHFSTFGPVQDVRIPSQQKRMFGFVTFLSAETVTLILSMGNPHYVCGARVLVKPYREKLKSVERKHLERFGYPAHYHTDIDSETQTSLGSSRMFHALCQEYEQALEIKGKRLLQLQLAGRSVSNYSCFRYSMNALKVHQEPFNYAGVLIGGSTSNDNSNKYPVNNCGDQESAQGLNLPDNPFASAAASSISAVI